MVIGRWGRADKRILKGCIGLIRNSKRTWNEPRRVYDTSTLVYYAVITCSQMYELVKRDKRDLAKKSTFLFFPVVSWRIVWPIAV
jgi:hypothetical protein